MYTAVVIVLGMAVQLLLAAPTISPCAQVEYGHSWNTGLNGKVTLDFSQAVSSWEVILTFDKPLTGLNFWNGEVTKISDKQYSIKNKNYNGAQAAGSVTFGWQANFANSPTAPKVVSTELVGHSCSGGGITTTAATTPSTATTLAVTTNAPVTGGQTSSCLGINHGHSWQQGQQGSLDITFPQSVSSWEIEVQFDKPLNNFDFYEGQVTKIDDTTYRISNKNYNGQQTAGNAVKLGWQALFSTSNTPAQMISANFIGLDCGAATVATSTSSTTTIPTTSSTTTVPTTSSTTTLTITTTNPSTTTSTETPSSNCLSINHGHSWQQGQQGSLDLTFPQAVSSWEIEVQFDKPLDRLDFYEGQVTKIDATTYRISNKNYNGQQAAGNSLKLGWQAAFSTSDMPAQMISASFIGLDCGASGSTTSIPTTAPPSTSSPATTQSTTVETSTVVVSSTTSSLPSTSAPTTTTPTTATPTTSPSSNASSCTGITKYDYNEVLELSNLFYQAQRSGDLDAYGDYDHTRIPYRGNSALQDGSDNGVKLDGGYYDGKNNFCKS